MARAHPQRAHPAGGRRSIGFAVAFTVGVVGCGGPQGANPPQCSGIVEPCADAPDLAQVGVWAGPGEDDDFAYDGCSVSYRWEAPDYIVRVPFGDEGSELTIDVSGFGEPPFFRTTARWEGPSLSGTAVGLVQAFGRWNGRNFESDRSGAYLHRAPPSSPIARELACVRGRLLTEDEIRMGRPRPSW